MKRILSILFVFLTLAAVVRAGDPPRHHIIIETDGTPDDLRALNLILSSKNTEVLAITSTDGVLEPGEGFMKIRALLNSLGHQGIITGKGIITKNESSPHRALARSISWGKEPLSYSQPIDVKELLIQVIEQEEAPVEVVSLGPLTNIANAILMKPSVKQKISRIIWFDQCQPDIQWSNYGMDCLSADYLLNTQIPVYRIMAGEKPPAITSSFLKQIESIPSPYARSIRQSHDHDSISQLIEKDNLWIGNELAALYLYYPDLFERQAAYPDSAGRVMTIVEPDSAQARIIAHLKNQQRSHEVVFDNFPSDSASYQEDVQAIVDELISLYGVEEWRAISLTAELKGYLDIASVVGAKMGIRVLEYFHTFPGQFAITSYCGLNSPLSSMNDGLRIACNAAPGSRKMQINQDDDQPKALVKFHDRTIEITLKKTYHSQLTQAMEMINRQNRYGSAPYWEALREQAIRFWKAWDRKEIFRITETTLN